MERARILVVEDDRAVADMLKMRLRGLGYDVVGVAPDGMTAIEKAREHQPDLVLMDIRLGEGIDGIDAARRIQAQRDMPIVYVTAYVDRQLLERARDTRPAGFINKPFTTKDLLSTIDLALHREISPAATAARDGPDDDPLEENVEAAITIGLDSRVSSVNRAAERQLGLGRKQTVGRPVAEILTTLYELSESAADNLVRQTLKHGCEQKILRTVAIGRDQVRTVTDTLTPLRDANGQDFGIALKFSAYTGNRSTTTLNQLVTAYARAIDAVPIGMLIVDGDLGILHINDRAREIIARNRGLDCRNERLIAEDKRLNQKLLDLVNNARNRPLVGKQRGSDAMSIKLPYSREQLEIVVTPVPGEHDGEAGSSVLIYLFDTGTDRMVSNEVLTRLYGLTQTEANLVKILVRGETIDEAARELAISINTARTHLKHIFHKTGINRQTELVHRIETGPAGLLLDFDAAQEPTRTSRR